MLKQKDWVNILSEKLGCSKKEAKEYYDFIFDSLKNTISLEESIKLSGFGVLKLRKTKDKEQINLVTGQVELVPEHNVITFKPYFEIEPKPKAIEVEDENVNAAFDIAAAVNIATKAAEEQVRESVEEAVVKEAPVEEVIVEEKDIQHDELSWVFNNEKYSENDMKKVLMENTELSETDIEDSLTKVKSSLRNVTPESTTIQVVEEKDRFDFSKNIQHDELSWIFNNEKYSENDIKKVLMQKTELSEADVEASLSIVKNSLKDVAPKSNTIQVVEEKDTFNFIFEK